jgi:uncharacterized protein YkwD
MEDVRSPKRAREQWQDAHCWWCRLRSFSVPAHRWMHVALLCQVVLAILVSAPAALQPQALPLDSTPGPLCERRDAPLFSEVLAAASRPTPVAPTATPQPTIMPTPAATPAPIVTPALPAATARPPVRYAVAQPTPAPLPPVEPTATPAPAPAVAPIDGCERIIALVNHVREESGLSPLSRSPQLSVAAQRYADFIAAHDALNHTADGRTLDKRAEAAGYTTWVTLGENLAGGYATFEEALTAWLASPTHRDNIMNADFAETGVGCAWNPSSSHGSFFVQEFGAR